MMPDEILVVFSDQTDVWWLKLLRHGFRHCFVLIRFADIWISIDALAHKTEVMRIDIPDTFGLIQWLEGQGDKVIQCPVTHVKQRPLCPTVFSCVENTKRILGIQKTAIFTPWQLYRFLKSKPERNYHHG